MNKPNTFSWIKSSVAVFKKCVGMYQISFYPEVKPNSEAKNLMTALKHHESDSIRYGGNMRASSTTIKRSRKYSPRSRKDSHTIEDEKAKLADAKLFHFGYQ